ncbi:GNAT family N-acetyltransferase [Syntrophorhabdus aromaticivorans]|jgi:ribosomal protein S18 acetylase RimI-like enzyme|uniref:GNAT family N-acetyltransferase n=1 Tax=Syntrophorhabdus aromaticivorans TaxID=328301 RepID=A0A351U2U0_9BACT|nr:GNAT family N-acetyltransferase [Syntrophorhabdus aromaticivorans]NLW36171.1 GNAT family N-acetyltransferase [Syntrophorhabdus aromaticivorans]HBA54271.1 GNAT family N-acetyltransferase [Syntrophorhabdus aromaticivorans]
MITVRLEKDGDQVEIESVRAAATSTLRETYRPGQKALANRARISASFERLVALNDDIIIGTVQYRLENQSLRVIGLGVHTDHRRKGVARSLMSHLKEIAEREKTTALRLHTIKETGNVEVFTRLGFIVVAEQEDELMESDTFEKLTDVEMVMWLS